MKRSTTQWLRKIFSRWIFWAVVISLTLTDIFLLERKYNIFSGGFLQDHRISGFIDRSLFVTTLFSLECALAGFFWCAFNLIGIKRRLPSRQIDYLFLFIYGGISVALAVARYKILAYFGDFVSLAVVRNLGGGSLREGLLYGLDEGMTLAFWFAGAAVLCWAVFKALKLRPGEASHNISSTRPWILNLGMVVSLSSLAALTMAAHSSHAMSKYLDKTTPYELANDATSVFLPVKPTPLALLVKDAEQTPTASPAETYKFTFPAQKDNIVLIVSESTRADVIDANVGGRPVTPNWRALAAEGNAGRSYFSHTGFTTSSLKAIFRGSLGKNLPLGGTLFEILKAQGYQVVVLSGQDEAFGDIDKESGEAQSADIFFDARSAKADRVFSSAAPGSLTLSNGRILQQFDVIASQLDWHRPIFLYVNLQASHFPYFHPKMPLTITHDPLERSQISEDSLKKLKLTYLNAIAYSDWTTGQIVDRLKKRGVYEHSLVVVSGDHGESLFDDDILGHGIKITDKQMHALLVSNRAIAPLEGLVGQKDLAKYLLQGIGVKFDPNLSTAQEPVIQIIGALSAPSELGYVYKDGERLTVDLSDGMVSASWLPKPVKTAALAPKSREREETLRLVAEWRGIRSR